MSRMEKIARRVASTEVVALFVLTAKDRPSDLFGGTFFDIREKAKSMKESWEDEAVAKLTDTLKKDLDGRGAKVSDMKISLGKYRGSRFVTSAKLAVKVKDRDAAERLSAYLQSKYSPKFKLKTFDEKTGIAEYNVR